MSINTGCHTGYSAEIALGPMGSVDEPVADADGTTELDAARQDLLQEMAARAESMGPAGPPERMNEGSPTDAGEQAPKAANSTTSHVIDQDRQTDAPATANGGQAERDGQDGLEGAVDVAATISPALKDEHCIDDMYS